jgi:hypothetical protein
MFGTRDLGLLDLGAKPAASDERLRRDQLAIEPGRAAAP